jgi:3-deoxy-7-phosphoheptulonate synthase
MSEHTELQANNRVGAPDAIMASLPVSNYIENFQPDIDPVPQREAVNELQHTEAVTNPRQIDSLKLLLGQIAVGKLNKFIVLEGSCAESVDAHTEIPELVNEAMVRRRVVLRSKIGNKILHIMRNRGQATKPRSAEFEELEDGSAITSYQGDAVNSREKNAAARVPDATRQVSLAVQSRDLDTGLREEVGEHVPAAHETLLLSYENSFIELDQTSGKKYLVSADLPWIGKRTNAVDGPHVELLSRIENSVGIKIGADSTPEHITALNAKLNPDNQHGKLVFMLRVGKDNEEQLSSILTAIHALDSQQIVMYDIHGVTKSIGKHKIRAVPEIIDEITHLADLCNQKGIRLHGIHLETMSDDNETECVDEVTNIPSREGFVDPRLNPRQLGEILDAITDKIAA